MEINELLADRVRELIAARESNVEEKKMFSGLAFMVNEKLCVAVSKDRLLVRLDPQIYEEALGENGAKPMVHSGREMKGYVFVDDTELTTQKKLAHWVNRALAYNKVAKTSKKKK